MRSERLASKYKNNAVAGKRKHIYARLFDYFSLFVVSYLLFTIFYAIGARTPLLSHYSDDYSSKGKQIMNYVVSTRLQSMNEKGTELLDIREDAKVYIANIAKNSGYVNEIDLRIKDSDGNVTTRAATKEESFVNNLEEYEIDNLSYYYKKFKKTSEATVEGSKLNSYVIDEVDYASDIETYMYHKIMKVDTTLFVGADDAKLLSRGEGVSRFTVLNSEKATSLINYVLAGDPDADGKEVYNSLYTSYINGAQFGINDVEKNSVTYLQYASAFLHSYQTLIKSIAVIYFISYAVAFVLILVIMRLIGKEWTTIGLQVMKLGMSDRHEFTPSAIQIIGYHLMNFVLSSTSAFISLYFIGIFGVLSLELFKGFTLLALLLAILVLNVISFVMIFFGNIPNDLSTLVTRIVIKDKNEYDVPVGMENISDEELKQLNKKEVVEPSNERSE